MFIYNITFHIDDSIHKEALIFLKKEYIPQAEKGGLFFNPRLCHIASAEENDGWSYSVQFYVKNRTLLNDWWATTGKELTELLQKRFGSQVAGFGTLLEELDLDNE
jgi:hypothetical protein